MQKYWLWPISMVGMAIAILILGPRGWGQQPNALPTANFWLSGTYVGCRAQTSARLMLTAQDYDMEVAWTEDTFILDWFVDDTWLRREQRLIGAGVEAVYHRREVFQRVMAAASRTIPIYEVVGLETGSLSNNGRSLSARAEPAGGTVIVTLMELSDKHSIYKHTWKISRPHAMTIVEHDFSVDNQAKWSGRGELRDIRSDKNCKQSIEHEQRVRKTSVPPR